MYRELPCGDPLVACLWQQATRDEHPQRVVPDGCVDLIWLAGRALVFAGPDTGPREVILPAGTCSTGLRLRPGAAGPVLGLPAGELRDLDVSATLVWGEDADRLEEALAAATGAADRLTLLVRAVAARHAEPDRLITTAARRLATNPTDVGRLAADLGVSERQLHRRTVAAVGYGPKLLARVARLRRLVGATEGPLARRALDAGYASQAHMGDEVRRLTGVTPVRFLEDAQLTAA
jgi:methylphosphotriester-DNA--protein-cysteine methyltransferase